MGLIPYSSTSLHLPPLPPPPEPLIIHALTLLLQPQTFPVLVCCNMGRHRTGTVVGCYRKLQRWALSSILEEYRRYAGMKVRVLNEQVSHGGLLCQRRSYMTESRAFRSRRTARTARKGDTDHQFIELFDTDLVSVSNAADIAT